MEEKGLIERRMLNGNRRTFHIYLTKEGWKSQKLVEKLARGKCLAVAKDHPGAVVLGCDTVVDVGGEVFRAVKGGTGFTKCGGNYAGSILGQVKAEKMGYSQVLWLDGEHRK